RRLEKAREEGQVVRARELGTVVMLMAGVAGLWGLGGMLGRKLDTVMRAALSYEPAVAHDPARRLSRFAQLVWESLLGVLPRLLLFAV
ncbi:EscU/YscU/HrcU family type III secretion system export apparatus switch protein, partial [Salmonella enterica]|nr:EscU/YscU/HrcU family type III secretion system export apparatus switch protein [Salmonella enterica]